MPLPADKLPTLIAAGVLGAVFVGVALLGLGSWRAARRTADAYRRLMVGPKGEDLHQILEEQAGLIRALKQEVDGLREEQRRLRESSAYHLQHFGMLRYNAFETGSDLSFSAAILNGNRDGVVLTSLYSRDESRVYAKPIKNGASSYNLSGEEKNAIAAALSKGADG